MSDRFGLVVIGGGPAGYSAARGYRAAGGEGAVAIVTDEHRMPYRRPPLTKDLLRGETPESSLDLEDERWLGEQRVALISGRAVRLDPDAREVILCGGRTLRYARCVLATGAEPTRPPIPGADDPGVRVVRALDHVHELLRRLSAGLGRVAVIGSGFIGCEIASSLRRRGVEVRLLSDEPAPNEARLGPDAAAEIGRWLAEEGIALELGHPVEAISRAGAELRIATATGNATVDVVVMATGVAPRSELVAPLGIRLEHGAIPVDAAMRSVVPDVLAAGDVCQALNAAAGRPLRVEHWGDALTQGDLAGRSAAGETVEWAQVPGFWSTIGDRTLKHAAWGDGHDRTSVERHAGGAFTVWYGRDGRTVGVLTHRCDEAYTAGRELIRTGAAWPG